MKPPQERIDAYREAANRRAVGQPYSLIADALGVSVSTLRKWRRDPAYQRVAQEVASEIEELTVERMRGAANIAVDCLISIMTDKKSSTSARANAAMFVWRESGMSAAKEAQNVDDMSEDDVVDLLRTLPADLLARALEEVA